MLLPEKPFDWGDDADCRAGVSVAFAFGIQGKIGVVVFQLLMFRMRLEALEALVEIILFYRNK